VSHGANEQHSRELLFLAPVKRPNGERAGTLLSKAGVAVPALVGQRRPAVTKRPFPPCATCATRGGAMPWRNGMDGPAAPLRAISRSHTCRDLWRCPDRVGLPGQRRARAPDVVIGAAEIRSSLPSQPDRVFSCAGAQVATGRRGMDLPWQQAVTRPLAHRKTTNRSRSLLVPWLRAPVLEFPFRDCANFRFRRPGAMQPRPALL